MRMIGAFLIIVSMTLIGFKVAQQFNRRSKELRELNIALKMLETEISYGITPLPYAFEKIADSLDGAISILFRKARDYIVQGMTAETSWKKAVITTKNQFALDREDINILYEFSYNLGKTSVEDQVKYLKIIQHRIDNIYCKSCDEKTGKVKLWRYLGILIGLFLTILII